MSVPILLTACIRPVDVGWLQRNDPAVRLGDYLTALRYLLQNVDQPRIVFCDNSGADLTPVHDCIAQWSSPNAVVEVIGYAGAAPGTRGKGWGEMEIIGRAVEQSEILRNAPGFLKVTGRLILHNAQRLLVALESPKTDVMCDLRDNLAWADSRVFYMSSRFATERMLPLQDVINDADDVTFERVLGRAVHEHLAARGTWSMLPVTPDIRGVSGTANEPYDNSFVARTRRSLLRYVKSLVLAR